MSVEFEPVKLGPRRGRADPVAIGVVVVLLGLIAALLKPWDTSAGTGATASGGIAAAAAATPTGSGSLTGPHSTAGVAPPPVVTESTAAALSWAEVRAVVRPHDAWGIRAIVKEPSVVATPGTAQRFVEHWDPIPFDSEVIPSIDVQPNDRTVVAIGITFPASQMPLDTRIWLVHPAGLEWLDARPMDPSPSGGAFLYQLVGVGGAVENWTAGRYRVDVLVGGTVRWFGFTLPNRFWIVPDGAEPPVTEQGLVAPELVPVSELGIGPFAMVDGVAVPLAAHEGPGLTEADAWLNVDPGTGRAPRSFVASAYLPRATGLGVVLPAGSLIKDATVVRLVPDSLFPARADVIVFGGPNQKSFAGFLAPGGGAWAPGVYRFTVIWSDVKGLHSGNWHLELRPGPFYDPPSLLLAARAYARYAGASGVVLGTAEPVAGVPPDSLPTSESIRLVQPGPDGAQGFPVRDQVPCDGVRVEDSSGIVGVAYPVHAPPSKVTMRALYEFSRSEEQPILTARGDVPGLTLIAPAGDVAGISSAYRLRIGDDATVPGATVCLGIAPVD